MIRQCVTDGFGWSKGSEMICDKDSKIFVCRNCEFASFLGQVRKTFEFVNEDGSTVLIFAARFSSLM